MGGVWWYGDGLGGMGGVLVVWEGFGGLGWFRVVWIDWVVWNGFLVSLLRVCVSITVLVKHGPLWLLSRKARVSRGVGCCVFARRLSVLARCLRLICDLLLTHGTPVQSFKHVKRTGKVGFRAHVSRPPHCIFAHALVSFPRAKSFMFDEDGDIWSAGVDVADVVTG